MRTPTDTRVTGTASDLAALASQAAAAHREVGRHAQSMLMSAVTAGEALRQAKGLLPHGQWGGWLREHFPGSERTAQLYMRLASDPQRVAEMPDGTSLRTALAVLADEEPWRWRREYEQPDLPFAGDGWKRRRKAINAEFERWERWSEAIGMADLDDRVKMFLILLNNAPDDPFAGLGHSDATQARAQIAATADLLRVFADELDRKAASPTTPEAR